MKINISDLISNKCNEINIDVVEDIKLNDINGKEVVFLEPVSFVGKIKKNGNIIIEGKLTAKFEAECVRCLKKFTKNLYIDIFEFLYKNKEDLDDEEDGYLIENDTVDIYDILYNSIILNMPMKILCKEDCKGLCNKCGTNLNEYQCDCDNDDIDIRFSKLKDFFNSNKEV